MSLEERTTSSTGGQKGVKLERFDLIPVGPLTELATHFGRGATKYATHQWRAGYEWSKSYSSIQRHSNAFWAGQDYDVCENDPGGCAFLVAAQLGKDAIALALDSREVTRDLKSMVIRHGTRMYLLAAPVGEVEQGSTCYNHTGSHHMVAVAWHSFVLLEFKDTHPDHDDRYIVKIPETKCFQVPGVHAPGCQEVRDNHA